MDGLSRGVRYNDIRSDTAKSSPRNLDVSKRMVYFGVGLFVLTPSPSRSTYFSGVRSLADYIQNGGLFDSILSREWARERSHILMP